MRQQCALPLALQIVVEELKAPREYFVAEDSVSSEDEPATQTPPSQDKLYWCDKIREETKRAQRTTSLATKLKTLQEELGPEGEDFGLKPL